MAESLTPSMESERSISAEKQDGVQRTMLKTGEGKLSFQCTVAGARVAAKAGAFDVHDFVAYALPFCPVRTQRLIRSLAGPATSETDRSGSAPMPTQSLMNQESRRGTGLMPSPDATAQILDRAARAEELFILAILMLALIERRLLSLPQASERAHVCCRRCPRSQQPSDVSRAGSAAESAEDVRHSAGHQRTEEERPFSNRGHDRQLVLPSGVSSVNVRPRDGRYSDFARNTLRCLTEAGPSFRVTWSPDHLALRVSRVYYYSSNYGEKVYSPSSGTRDFTATLAVRCGNLDRRVVLLFYAELRCGSCTDLDRLRSQGRLEFTIHHPTCPARSLAYFVPASQPKRIVETGGVSKLLYRLTDAPVSATSLDCEGLWHLGTLRLSVKICA